MQFWGKVNTFKRCIARHQQVHKAYDAEPLIRNASDGKKYLYDIVAIKENTGLTLDLNEKARGRLKAAMQSDVSTGSISTSDGNVNAKFSMKAYSDVEKRSAPYRPSSRRAVEVVRFTITVYPLLTGMSTCSIPRKEWTASCRSALASSSLCPVRTTSML